jgi:transcriptional regulator ATRX
MVSFIKPNLLGSQQEYINRFVNPIQNGQHRDSNEADVCLMKRRACVLHELLIGFIDRKDYSLLKDYLPPKFEYIINIRLSDLQSILYDLYLKKQGKQQDNLIIEKKDFKSARLFADYQYLQKIWTHPFLLYPHFIDHWKKRLNKEADDLIDDDELEPMFTDEDEEIDEIKIKTKKKKNGKDKSKKNFSGFLIDNVGDEEEEEEGEVESSIKKSQKRTLSKSSNGSSVTTVESRGSIEDDDDDDDDEPDSDSKVKSNDDEKTEVVKNYRTRSRTAANNKQKEDSLKISNDKNVNSDIFDTGNDNIPLNNEQQDNSDEPWLNEMREQYWFQFLDMLPDESEFDIELGGKIFLFKSILDKCAEIGDKILLFSRSLYTLNYIERFLYNLQKQNEDEYQKQCETRRKLRELLSSNENNNHLYEYIPQPVQWIRDQDYFRMDGQTDVIARKRYAKSFNDPTNLRSRLFLISTLAGGIGINLIGSNRVIVFDASWNPSHDTQAIFRSYRFGQKKPVYIYRFLAQGTMEEKIYQRQVVKQSLSQRVIDDHQLDRHFTENDIKELYKFTPEQLPELRPTSNTDFNYPIPKDHLLLDLLYEHNQWIHSYHSHDSLLENKLDEGLSEEERRRGKFNSFIFFIILFFF